MHADGDVTQILRDLDGNDFVLGHRFGVAQIRRAEQPHRAARQGLEQALRRVQFHRVGGTGGFREIGMGEGVVADLVAFGEDALDQPGMGLGVGADDEEARLDVLFLQDVENCRRPLRIRPVVEGQRQRMRHQADAPDDISRRQFRIGFVVDVAGLGVDLEGAAAGGRIGLDAQDFAFAFEVHVRIGRDVLQRGRRRGAVRPAEHGPHRRVLAAQPPQGVTGRLIDVGGVDLVVGGDAVQEPDLVLHLVVFDVGEMRVVGVGIEIDARLGIPRGDGGVLERKVVGGALAVPVVSVIADGDDGAARRQFLHPLVERRLEPGLAGDGARRAGIVVFVIGHEHRIIDGLGEARVRPTVDRRKGRPERRSSRAARTRRKARSRNVPRSA